ncbi:hypothetical protein P7H19_25780 [Paenibacillus larvae]|nr:hypothetical protein [Paenibacillus larvae]MDT2239019.1 hypothetical protein [Paenibacillus larvae]
MPTLQAMPNPAIGFVFAKMSYGYLAACTGRPGRPLNPTLHKTINSFLGPGWKDADEAGNTESRDWIHFLRK